MSDKVKVYVWEIPVRLTHWINAVCLIALSITGYYVADPFIYAQSSDQYIMGWMRFIHFVSAYAFLMSIIIRLYWSIMGNKYACMCDWFPFSGKKIGEIIDDMKVYLFINKRVKPHVGHSALAGVTYLLLLGVFIFEIISGFALYSVTHSGMIWTILGGWLTNVMYLQTIRLWHHLFMYLILAFTLLHIYMAVFTDSVEESGVVMSIFTGNKSIPEEDMQ
jgi:Ni/Fe-hydrogenase 1 B-type cytochrome subunit